MPVFTVSVFKERIEGSRKKMKDDRPEVWVTLKELCMQEESQSSFSLSKFQLQGFHVLVVIAILGSNLQIVQEIGSETALKIMDKVGVNASTKRSNSELCGKVPATSPKHSQLVGSGSSLIETRERMEGPDKVAVGSGGWEKGEEAKTFEVRAMVVMTKELGEEEVAVNCRDLETTVNGTMISISSDPLRKHIEGALAKRATEVVQAQAKERSGGFRLRG